MTSAPVAGGRGWIFWIPWSVDMIIAFVALYFFCAGLADGTVSSFNILIWITLLAPLGLVVGGGLLLRATGHPGLAKTLVLLLAVPGVLVALFFLLLIASGPSFH